MPDIETRDRGSRPHRHGFRQFDPGRFGRLQQIEQGPLFGMIGLRRIAGRGANAGIAFGDQFLIAEILARGIAPMRAADAFMHHLGKRLGETIRQRLHHDRGIIVGLGLEAGGDLVILRA